MGVLPVLFCIFVTLKLIGVIDWSWWLVCSPLYPAALLFVGWVFFAFRVSR